MEILIGMDEAGYGPHLGPLAIAATAWHVDEESDGLCEVPQSGNSSSGKRKKNFHAATSRTTSSSTTLGNPKSLDPIDLYRLLRTVVAKKSNPRRVPIADSKVLYAPSAGLQQLERGLHTVLRSIGQTISCWSEIVDYCGADADGHHKSVCWPDGFDCTIPIDASCDELVRLETRFTRACEAARVRPLFIRARLVFPAQFNDLIERYGNKAAALSHVTVGLLREVVDTVTNAISASPAASRQPPIYSVCDKHGGRNFYTALLQHHFSEYWIEPVYESHAESRYEWGEPESRTRVIFRMNGERFLPTALASMTAKYLRELSMRAFNEFWRAHLPDIKPTAGYYRDAWRFKKEIASKQRELRIDDRVLWRTR